MAVHLSSLSIPNVSSSPEDLKSLFTAAEGRQELWLRAVSSFNSVKKQEHCTKRCHVQHIHFVRASNPPLATTNTAEVIFLSDFCTKKYSYEK